MHKLDLHLHFFSAHSPLFFPIPQHLLNYIPPLTASYVILTEREGRERKREKEREREIRGREREIRAKERER